jgi:fucose 4-O-acetylase-like acetyltransferase
VGIVLVVLGHANRGLHEASLVGPATFLAIDSRIYAFHMPLFFMLSGMFMLRGAERGRAGETLVRRTWSLLYPLILWTYVFIALKIVAGPLTNHPSSWSDLATSPVPGYLHLWFLWALLVIQAAVILFRAIVPMATDATVVAGTLLGAVALQFAPLPDGLRPVVGTAISYAPFVAAGMALGLWRQTLATVPAVFSCLAGAAFVMLLVTVPNAPRSAFWDATMALGLSLALIIAVIGVSKHSSTSWLASIGQAAIAIYLAHTIFSAAMRIALVGVGVSDLLIHLALGTLVGIAGPYWLFDLSVRRGWNSLVGWR